MHFKTTGRKSSAGFSGLAGFCDEEIPTKSIHFSSILIPVI
jgi:hypothetical protein